MVGHDPTPCNHCGALNQLCACRNCGKLAILESGKGTTWKCSHCHEKLEPCGGFVRQPSRPHGGVFGAVSAPGQMAYEGPGYDGSFRMGGGRSMARIEDRERILRGQAVAGVIWAMDRIFFRPT